MKKNLIISLLALAAVLLAGCKIEINGPALEEEGGRVTQTFDVEKFSAISVQQGIRVVYTQGEGAPRVEAEAAENVMELLRVSVENGQLELCYDESVQRVRHVNTIVRVTAPAFSALAASSGADVDIENGMAVEGSLSLTVSSGATVNAKRISCSGLTADVSSGADLALDGLKADNFALSVSSGADADVKGIAAGGVSATASSASDITLAGSCKTVNLAASSGADIEAAHLAAESGSGSASSGGDVTANVKGAFSIAKSSGGSVTNR